MRVLSTLGCLMLAIASYGHGRIQDHPHFEIDGTEVPFELALTPPLELGPLPSAALTLELPFESIQKAATPSHRVMFGQSRGAMLDRCRFRMRKVSMIGHGASPDGRPDTCRLLSFVGLTKKREIALDRRAPMRVRFEEMTVAEMPEPYRPYIPGAIYPKTRPRTYIGVR